MDPTLPEPEVTELEGDLATQRWLLALQLFYGLTDLAELTKASLTHSGFDDLN
jgi:hypothetical protein